MNQDRSLCPHHGMVEQQEAGMNVSEQVVLGILVEAAEHGARCPSNEDIAEKLGFALSAPPQILNRLERRGEIAVERYQRSRRVTVISTGKATAPVKNKTPHWRAVPRPASMPSLSPTYVQQRRPDLARDMMVAARHEGLTFQDFVLELIWAGWCSRQAVIQHDSEQG
jgi:DNA-binding MarR family transcriptional regulator